jgi:hypothetical protein
MLEKVRHELRALALLRPFGDGEDLAEFTGMIELGNFDQLTEQIIGSAIAVHNTLGPGLLESIYHRCLVIELRARTLRVETDRPGLCRISRCAD